MFLWYMFLFINKNFCQLLVPKNCQSRKITPYGSVRMNFVFLKINLEVAECCAQMLMPMLAAILIAYAYN